MKLKTYRCVVLGDTSSHRPHTFYVEAPSPKLAQLLAFAMDGGLGNHKTANPEEPQGWEEAIAVAQSYTSAEVVAVPAPEAKAI